MNPFFSKYALTFVGILASTTGIMPGYADAASQVTTKSIPVTDFFKAPQFTEAALSPDGKHISMLTADQNDHLILSILDTETLKPRILARYADIDIGNVRWVNNRRVIYSLYDRKGAQGEVESGSGLFAADIDGNNQRQLIARNYAAERKAGIRTLSTSHSFFDTISGDTNDIYVIEYVESGSRRRGSQNLVRLDTVTGQKTVLPRPGEVDNWYLDEKDNLRIVTTWDKGHYTVLMKDETAAGWHKLYEFAKDDPAAVRPEFIGQDGHFYVSAQQGKDTRSLYRYDTDKKSISPEPVISLDGYDYNGIAIVNSANKKILGFRYHTDAPGTLWFDERYQQIQKKIDTLLPGKINSLRIRRQSDSDIVLVRSFSDIDPGTYYLFNHKTSELTLLGQERPWINPKQMAYRDFVKYKARDGLTIPAYLTLPKEQKKNLPLVVLVHGGPNIRGEYWNWDAGSQFLASRGYAVLQPEFRGSTGYGFKHEQLGWKQWGLTMQDDVTDGTKWAIEQGIADPKRICIAGASYGGYAALWGLVKEPALYQCGISWVGVTDIRLLYTLTQSDSNDDVEKYFLPKKAGDLKLDAAQLKATSVIENADKLKAPLILAYGGSDRRVPVEHGERLKRAMNGANPNLEWIVYPEEGHGWNKLKNNVDFWSRVEKFLDRHTWKQDTGKADKPAAPASN